MSVDSVVSISECGQCGEYLTFHKIESTEKSPDHLGVEPKTLNATSFLVGITHY